MSNEKNRVEELIPQSLLELAVPFVDLLKKYYEFMNLEGNPSQVINRDTIIRDVEQATDFFLNRVYAEVGKSFYINKDNIEANTANVLENLRILYNAKGSLESIKVLFRIIFGEEVDVWLPKEFIFKSSAGTLTQDYSVTATLTQGDPFQIVGEFAEVVTNLPGLPEQRFETEITRIENIDNTYYRLFITKESIAVWYEGSTISYLDTVFTVGQSLNETTAKISNGSSFRAGQLYDINDYQRNTSEATIVGYYSEFQKYYDDQTFERRYITNEPVEKYATESVTVKSYTDGLRIESVLRGSDSYSVLRYGQRKITVIENADGTKEYLNQTDSTRPVHLNPVIDWDTVLIELAKIANGDNTGSLYSFLTTVDVSGFQYGDIDNDGDIDQDDVEILLRSLMSYNTSSANETWIRDIIETNLLLISYPTPTAGSGQNGKLQIQTVDGSGAIVTSKISVFGQNYPEYFITFFENGGNYSIQILGSNYISKSSAYYVDNQGETSEATIKLQDNFFYQDLSYVIRTGTKYDEFEKILYKTVHPAGMKAFGELTISQQLNLSVAISNAIALHYNRLFYELTQFTEIVTKVITKDLNILNPTNDSILLSEADPTFSTVKNVAVDVAQFSDSGSVFLYELYVDSGYFYDDYDYVGISLAETF